VALSPRVVPAFHVRLHRAPGDPGAGGNVLCAGTGHRAGAAPGGAGTFRGEPSGLAARSGAGGLSGEEAGAVPRESDALRRAGARHTDARWG